LSVDRRAHAVLVPQAQAIGMIGVIRSLGAAGYRVHAVSSDADALGLQSALATHTAVHPDYTDPAFLPWLDAYLTQHAIAAIVPSEGFLLAIEPAFERYRTLIPDASDPEVLYRAFAKADVEAHFARHADAVVRQHLPRAAVLEAGQPLPDDAQWADWEWPLYVKCDGRHAMGPEPDSIVRPVATLAALRETLTQVLRTHRSAQVQETVPGVKATVNLWRHRGATLAESMCVAMHENPHTGGLTAYRRVWWHEAMHADAVRRLAALDWSGVAMVEYRYDAASDRFWFLELNARYWNALNLDLLAGKDFPRYQVDAFLGLGLTRDLGPGPLGFRARYTVPADVGYLMSRLRDGQVGWGAKLWTLCRWVGLCLNPAVHSDLWFPGDRGLYWKGWGRFLSKLGRSA
jgi:hypothetical protein